MSEPEKIKVNKPTGYLEVPMEAKLPNGSKPVIVRSIEEVPAIPAKDPSGDLINAANTVFRVLTAKIAFHEKEAQRLREALAPFANHARQSAAPVTPSDNESIEALLRIAHHLNSGEQGQ